MKIYISGAITSNPNYKEDFEKASEVNSNTQLYKQAGNSIVRNVLVAIIGQMIPGKEEIYQNI